MDRPDKDSGDMLKPSVDVATDPTQDQTELRLQLKAARSQRLASALRQNLKGRKLSKVRLRPVDERN